MAAGLGLMGGRGVVRNDTSTSGAKVVLLKDIKQGLGAAHSRCRRGRVEPEEG
jgi:hypothetical protein